MSVWYIQCYSDSDRIAAFLTTFASIPQCTGKHWITSNQNLSHCASVRHRMSNFSWVSLLWVVSAMWNCCKIKRQSEKKSPLDSGLEIDLSVYYLLVSTDFSLYFVSFFFPQKFSGAEWNDRNEGLMETTLERGIPALKLLYWGI